MSLSLPKTGRLQGLAFGDNLARLGAPSWCGLIIVDIERGAVVEWLNFGASVERLFDVAVPPAMRCATGIAPDSAELQEVMTVEQA